MTDLHSLGGLYATDALDGDRREAFEHHLDACASCRTELRGFSETTGRLGALVDTPAPPALRDSVLQAISTVRPLAPDTAGSGPAPTATRLGRTARLFALAAAVMLVAALGLGGWALDLRHRVETQRADAIAQTHLLSAPDLRVLPVRLPDGSGASYLVSRRTGRAAFVSTALGDPGRGRAYQLWTVRRGAGGASTFVPDVAFAGGASRVVWLTTDVARAAAVGLTIEPAGGSRIPSMPPFAVQRL